MRPTALRLTALALLAAAAAAVTLLVLGREDGAVDARSWAPAPATLGGTKVLASAGDGRYRLRTRDGDVGFLPGVNLGATTPGHQPGELAIRASDYRRWFVEMGELGLRAVRIYTIHPPSFYTELARYNEEHVDAPLYLLQGVYLPDETYNERPRGLYDAKVDRAFAQRDRRRRAGRARRARAGTAPRSRRGPLEDRRQRVACRLDHRGRVGPLRRRAHGCGERRSAGGARAASFAVPPRRRRPSDGLRRHMESLAGARARTWRLDAARLHELADHRPASASDRAADQEDLAGVDANHVLPTEGVAGRDVRELPRLSVLPGLPAPRAGPRVVPARRRPRSLRRLPGRPARPPRRRCP